jgi:hypothetical protein
MKQQMQQKNQKMENKKTEKHELSTVNIKLKY